MSFGLSDKERAIRDEALARAGFDYDRLSELISRARLEKGYTGDRTMYLYEVVEWMREKGIDEGRRSS